MNLVIICVPTHNRVDLWRNLCTSLLYFVLPVRCLRKESSRSLSHLLMSFLLNIFIRQILPCVLIFKNNFAYFCMSPFSDPNKRQNDFALRIILKIRRGEDNQIDSVGGGPNPRGAYFFTSTGKKSRIRH